MPLPWEDPNNLQPGDKITVDMVVKTINAAHAIGAIQDIVVAFNFFDPQTGYKSTFRNSSVMTPNELIGMMETTKMFMMHKFFHGENSL